MFNRSHQPRFTGPHQLRPSLHSTQMKALVEVKGVGSAGLNTRNLAGLGIALAADDRTLRRFFGKLG